LVPIKFNLPNPWSGSTASSGGSENSHFSSKVTPVINNRTLLEALNPQSSTPFSPIDNKLLSFSTEAPTVEYLTPISPTISRTLGATEVVSMENNYSDDDTIPYPASDTESAACSVTENIEGSDLVNPDNYNLVDIARGILEDKSNDSLMEEEQRLIANSTVNTQQYESNKHGVEKRFFDTLDSYGGTLLKPL